MKKFVLAAAALIALPTSAYATGTISCQSSSNRAVMLDLVIGNLAGPVVAQARFTSRGRRLTTGDGGPMLMQAWLEPNVLHLDIADANGEIYLAQLRTWRRGRSGAYTGTLRIDGRTHQVRCTSEDEG